jgi:hypothetical protein
MGKAIFGYLYKTMASTILTQCRLICCSGSGCNARCENWRQRGQCAASRTGGQLPRCGHFRAGKVLHEGGAGRQARRQCSNDLGFHSTCRRTIGRRDRWPITPPRSSHADEVGFVVCRACLVAWRWKSSAQPDGGEGLARRKGCRRKARSEGSAAQKCELMDKNRI